MLKGLKKKMMIKTRNNKMAKNTKSINYESKKQIKQTRTETD